MKKLLFITMLTFTLFSCKSVNLAPSTEIETITEEQEKLEEEQKEQEILIEEIAAEVTQEKQIIFVEKPVYRPAEEMHKTAINPEEAVINNIVTPATYNGSAMIYDYQENFVYEVYTKVLRITDIYLEPGEKISKDLTLSDTNRFIWSVDSNKDSSGLERQHVYIKPQAPGLEGTLIINTNLRTYHLILKSYSGEQYMPIVRWKYPQSAVDKLRELQQKNKNTEPVQITTMTNDVSATFPNFNFKITYSVFNKPQWLPELVYAYEGKTYIQMPKSAFERELPGVFGEKNNLINYRLAEHTFVIDKLLDTITLKLDGKKVTIKAVR